jgi:hypothetical protein
MPRHTKENARTCNAIQSGRLFVKVATRVQIVGRRILAGLRNRRFFSLAALKEAIRSLLIDLNGRTLRGRLEPHPASTFR